MSSGTKTGKSNLKSSEKLKATKYIHGFSQEEQDRLRKQAEFMEFIVYRDVNFSQEKNILEVGSGVGAQTAILLRRFPNLHVTCIDLNDSQIKVAQSSLDKLPYAKGRFDIEKMDATKMKYADDSFDGAFLCWVLEHVPDPQRVLSEVRRVLRPGSRVYITEVTNFAFLLDPYSPSIWKFWMALNDHQYDQGGDPFVGIKLGNFLRDAGFTDVRTDLKITYADKRNPELREKVIKYWRDLIFSAEDSLIEAGKVDKELVKAMRKEFESVLKDPNSIIYDSFMQASARVP